MYNSIRVIKDSYRDFIEYEVEPLTNRERMEIVKDFKTICTLNQVTFADLYLANGKFVPATAKKMGQTNQALYNLLKSKQVQLLLKLMEMPITEEEKERKDSAPTLEYLSAQWDLLYNRALASGDDKAASQILDKRMKYYETFEELRKEDKVNLSKLTIKELVAYEKARHTRTLELLTKGKQNEWKEMIEEVHSLPASELAS